MEDAQIPDDFDGDYCEYSVCWPSSRQWLAVLRGVLTIPFDGRFWNGNTGSILGAKAQIEPTLTHNLQNIEVIMSCSSDVSNALLQIAAALNNQTAVGGGSGSGCCGGSTGGAGMYPPNPGGVDTTDSDPATDPPPEGYDSWEQYETQRCGVATQIMEDLQTSLGQMTIIVVSGLSVEALVELLIVTLTLTISTAGLVAIAGLLLTIGATVICATALSLVNDNFAELVCALLDGTNSQTSRASFLAKWYEIVDDAAIDPIEGFAIKQLIEYMVGNEEINRMYTPNSAIDYSGYSCPGCEDECFTFDEDTEGFTVQTLSPSEAPDPDYDHLGLVTQEDGTLLITAGIAPNSFYYGGTKSPEMDYEIQTGDKICISITDITNIVMNLYFAIKVDGDWIDFSPVSGGWVPQNREIDISDWAGQQLEQFFFMWGTNVSAWSANITETGVNCPACAGEDPPD